MLWRAFGPDLSGDTEARAEFGGRTEVGARGGSARRNHGIWQNSIGCMADRATWCQHAGARPSAATARSMGGAPVDISQHRAGRGWTVRWWTAQANRSDRRGSNT